MSAPVQCPFCQNPELFHADFSFSASRSELGLSSRGRFFKRLQNEPGRLWPIPIVQRELDGLHSKLVVGRDHFAPKWQPLTVEILGCEFTEKPHMPPVPLFGMDTRRGFETTYTLWHACRITHEGFSFVLNLHWWPTHGRIFTVEEFDFETTEARSALNTALSLFARGRGKPSEYFQNNKQFFETIRAAVMRRYDEGTPTKKILAIDIAEELFPEANDDGRTLRRWLPTSWPKWKWKDVVNAIIESVRKDREERGHN